MTIRGDQTNGRSAGGRLEAFCASLTAQLIAVAATTFVASWAQWHNDGLWFQGDAPRHVANGIFLFDLARFLPSQPLDFALSYYARYPIIVPIAYPPLFYVIEAAAFGLSTPSPLVAKALVWGFTAVTALYIVIWARRRLSPFAGWAGVSVVLMPSMLIYSNAVLLNVPSTAFCVAALYHFQEWLDRNRPSDRRLFLLLTLAALFTYYPSGIVLPIAIAWMLGSRRDIVRSSALWVVVAVLAGLLVVVGYSLPVFTGRMIPSLSRWLTADAWTVTIANLVRAVDPRWLSLAAVGVAIGVARANWRQDALRIAAVFPIVLVVLVVIPAASDRYALILAPIAVLATFLGFVAGVEIAGAWRRWVMAGGLVALLFWSGIVALGTDIREASGFRQVAEYVTANGPRDSVLYSGRHDGIFGLYLRILDPGFERRLVVTNRFLYRFAQGQLFRWNETPHVSSAAEVVSMIQQRSGCRWVAVEISSRPITLVSEQYLRQALEGPEFERVGSFPVRTPYDVTRVDLYRFRGELGEPPPLDLQFPSFSHRVFQGVRPVER